MMACASNAHAVVAPGRNTATRIGARITRECRAHTVRRSFHHPLAVAHRAWRPIHRRRLERTQQAVDRRHVPPRQLLRHRRRRPRRRAHLPHHTGWQITARGRKHAPDGGGGRGRIRHRDFASAVAHAPKPSWPDHHRLQPHAAGSCRRLLVRGARPPGTVARKPRGRGLSPAGRTCRRAARHGPASRACEPRASRHRDGRRRSRSMSTGSVRCAPNRLRAHWWVLEAPTGQRFCVLPPQRPDFPDGATAWP